MDKALGLFIVLLLISGCSDDNQEGFFSKASTNTGLTCQKDDDSALQALDEILRPKAIYDEDNRLDWFESPGQTKDYWAKATIALVPRGALEDNDGETLISAAGYAETVGLCPGHRFAEQPTAAFCSGFLVSDELVVTAGHCIRDISECQNTQFVFDFAKHEANQKEYKVPTSSVYQCAEIVAQTTGSEDFALIRLNRKVVDRTPLNIRRQGQLALGEQVMLIGHPMGMPSKIADGGFVQSVGNKILASVDAFAANSGSVILNSQTGLVEGILVAGEPDYQFQNGCRVEAQCGAGCAGEVITPISKLVDIIPDIHYPNPICD